MATGGARGSSDGSSPSYRSSAHAGPRGTAARLGLAALAACIGLTWTAGASDAFATYGTVTIKKVNVGGDQADTFDFTSS